MSKWTTYIIGMIVSLIITLPIPAIAAYIASLLHNTTVAPVAIVALGFLAWFFSAFLLFMQGIYTIPERHKAVPTFLGSPVQFILPDGYVWWFPSWLGGGIMSKVSVAKQTMQIKIGSTATGSGSIYTKDGTPVAIDMTIVYSIQNVWKWVVEFEADPTQLISDYAERIIRWFTDEFEVEEFVKLNAAISNVLKNDIPPDGRITVKVTVQKDNGHGIPVITTIEREVTLPENITKDTLKDALNELGAQLDNVMVRQISVPEELARTWMRRAQEVAERHAENADAKTAIMNAKMLADETGMPMEEALLAVERMRGRNVQTYHVPGLSQIASLFAGYASTQNTNKTTGAQPANKKMQSKIKQNKTQKKQPTNHQQSSRQQQKSSVPSPQTKKTKTKPTKPSAPYFGPMASGWYRPINSSSADDE